MFDFKQFSIDDSHCGMKIGTDGVLVGAWCRLMPHDCRILDAGAGSGLIALMMAQRAPKAHIDAVEIDAEAAADSRANIKASPWSERINCVCADVTTLDVAPYDLIVSNPPFFTSGELAPDAARASARHQGAFGPRALLGVASKLLAQKGRVVMITPIEGADDLVFNAEMLRLKLTRRCDVSSVEGRAPMRVLWEFGRIDGRPELSSLAIRHADGTYTQQYINLVSPFYIKL